MYQEDASYLYMNKVTVRNVFSGSLSGNRAPKPKLGNFRAEYAHIMTDLEVPGVSHR